MAPGLGHTILYIDDDPNDILLTRVVLERAGYTVFSAKNGAEALNIIGRESIDLVLLDQMLRGLRGTEIAKEIKGLRPEVLVVLFSGMVDPPDSDGYIDMFIHKDAGPAEMLARIASLLGPDHSMRKAVGEG